jgi:hypothetical protein
VGCLGVGARLEMRPQCASEAATFSLPHTIYGVSNAFKTLPVVYLGELLEK